jgi:hypothetical protein
LRHALSALAALALAAPVATLGDDAAKPAPSPEAPAAAAPAGKPAEEVLGEVVAIPEGSSAAYSATRVFGPRVNVTETEKGTWSGSIRLYDGVMVVTEKRISAAAMNIVVDREGDEWVAQGTWEGKRVRVTFTKEKVTLRIDNRFYEMTRVAPDMFATLPRGPGLRVKGDAAGASPRLPQFLFALLSSF